MPHSLTDLQPQARAWLLAQIAEGKTDSGLAQRFYAWLRQHSESPLDYTAMADFFLRCCKAEHVHAAIINDRSVYGIYPDGIAPQPEYKEPTP